MNQLSTRSCRCLGFISLVPNKVPSTLGHLVIKAKFKLLTENKQTYKFCTVLLGVTQGIS